MRKFGLSSIAVIIVAYLKLIWFYQVQLRVEFSCKPFTWLQNINTSSWVVVTCSLNKRALHWLYEPTKECTTRLNSTRQVQLKRLIQTSVKLNQKVKFKKLVLRQWGNKAKICFYQRSFLSQCTIEKEWKRNVFRALVLRRTCDGIRLETKERVDTDLIMQMLDFQLNGTKP